MNIRTSVLSIPAARAVAARYLSCLRLQEILILQGSPLLGAAFAIRHLTAASLGPLALLLIADLCLVSHIFMLNDWSGLTTDLADPNKAAGVFTARGVGREEIGGLAAGLLAVSLLLFSRLGPSALCLALAIATLSALYSLPRFNWKGRPLLSSAAHLAGGVLHFLLGYSLGSAIDLRGIALATFFALTFAAGHLTQEIRDHQGDLRNAIRTNAVIFGQRRTFAASLVLFTLAYALLLLLALQGILPRLLAALVALYPLHLRWSLDTLAEGLTYASIRRLQARYRALYAIVGLAMVAALCGAPGHPQALSQNNYSGKVLPLGWQRRRSCWISLKKPIGRRSLPLPRETTSVARVPVTSPKWSGASSMGTGASPMWTGASSMGIGASSMGTGASSMGTGASSMGSGASSMGTGASPMWSGASPMWSGASSMWSGASPMWSGASPMSTRPAS
jgi:4-hydroxybenzoate polyprenyltransferase